MHARERKPASDRPTWFLAPGGRPVPASSRRVPEGCRYRCREGDVAWTPIDRPDQHHTKES